MTKEALKLALDALEARCGTNADERGPDGAITALREALAQPEQEPDMLTIAYMSGLYEGRKLEREAIFNIVQKIAARFYKDATEEAFDELTDAILLRGNT